ncbi:sensor histidine kinase, partial [bacterium]|nr:sensor histidine kinase [bacterium]
HQVSMMTVQAGAAKTVARDDLDAAVEAMGDVERAGRQALGELRHLLGVLRPEQSEPGAGELVPQPGLGGVPALVDRLKATGAQVSTTLEDLGDLPTAVDLSAFRIVQESVTNIVKHAGASFVSIVVNMNEDGVHMVIEDDGEGFKADKVGDQNGETGYGIEFMKERVALLGGSFEIETAPGQGTTLFIQIPTVGEVNHD